MKKLLFIIGLTFVLFSCEKNYSCKCKYYLFDNATNQTILEAGTTINPLEAKRKIKAKKECADSNFTLPYSETITQHRECMVIVSE